RRLTEPCDAVITVRHGKEPVRPQGRGACPAISLHKPRWRGLRAVGSADLDRLPVSGFSVSRDLNCGRPVNEGHHDRGIFLAHNVENPPGSWKTTSLPSAPG